MLVVPRQLFLMFGVQKKWEACKSETIQVNQGGRQSVRTEKSKQYALKLENVQQRKLKTNSYFVFMIQFQQIHMI